MFQRLSHRTRLTLTTSLAAGLLLAIVFLGVVWFYSRTELDGVRLGVHRVFNALKAETEQMSEADAAEALNSDPSASAAMFLPGGKVLRAGNIPLVPILGAGRMRFGKTEALYEGAKVRGASVVAAESPAEADAAISRLEMVLTILWLPLVGCAAAASWLAASATFRPVAELTRQAAEISGTAPGRRLVAKDRAEFGTLANQLNGLLDRIESNARSQERFAADAAHELRTPLTILKGQMETALLQSRTPTEYQETLRKCVDEVSRVSRLVETLLLSARLEANDPEAIDTSSVVDAAAARWLDRFQSKGIKFEEDSQPAIVKIGEDELGCVVDNLLDNALRFTPQGGRCAIFLSTDGHEARLKVEDSGQGIPDEMSEKIFDRFVRASSSRNRETGGFGIGLSVCKRIVEGRGGSIAACASPLGGALIEITLPLCAGGRSN